MDFTYSKAVFFRTFVLLEIAIFSLFLSLPPPLTYLINIHLPLCVPFSFFTSLHSGSSALPSNMAYFGSSQEEEDLEEDDEEEEEEVRIGGGIQAHGWGSSSQASASSSCHSTPRKGKLPARQPLNGHGKDRIKSWK